MAADESSWRTTNFRQSVVAKIEEAIRSSGMPTSKNSMEMENHVFQKAKSKEEYLGFVARLILHVREMRDGKHPVLHDFTLPQCSRHDDIERSWNEVSSKLNLKAEECKDRWNNLQTLFAQKLRQPLSGSGAKKKTSNPPLSGNLPDSDEIGNSTSNLQEEIAHEPDIGYEELNNSTRTVPTSSTPTHPLSALDRPSDIANVLPAEQQTSRMKRKIDPKQKAEFEADKSIAAYFTTKKSKIETQPNKEEATDKKEEYIKMFLLSLLPDLTKFSDSQLRAFKRNVLTLIDNIVEPVGQVASNLGSSTSTVMRPRNVTQYYPLPTTTSSETIGTAPAIESTEDVWEKATLPPSPMNVT